MIVDAFFHRISDKFFLSFIALLIVHGKKLVISAKPLWERRGRRQICYGMPAFGCGELQLIQSSDLSTRKLSNKRRQQCSKSAEVYPLLLLVQPFSSLSPVLFSYASFMLDYELIFEVDVRDSLQSQELKSLLEGVELVLLT